MTECLYCGRAHCICDRPKESTRATAAQLAPMCERKTNDIIQREGYEKTGYVLKKVGSQVCVSDGGAVAWFTPEQWQWLMFNRDHIPFHWPAPIGQPAQQHSGNTDSTGRDWLAIARQHGYAFPDARMQKFVAELLAAREPAPVARDLDVEAERRESIGWVDDGGMVFWKEGKPPADGTDLFATPAPVSTEQAAGAPRIADMALLIARLSYSLKRAAPEHEMPAKATAYLKKHNLIGSPLRAPSPNSPVGAKEQDK